MNSVRNRFKTDEITARRTFMTQYQFMASADMTRNRKPKADSLITK
jgi:hypothetical protein